LQSLALAVAAVVPAIRAVDAVTDIPRLSGVVIDGQTSDWADRGFQIRPGITAAIQARSATSCQSHALAVGLILACLVRVGCDRRRCRRGVGRRMCSWQKDSVEFFISAGADCSNRYQLVVAPGTNSAAVGRHWV